MECDSKRRALGVQNEFLSSYRHASPFVKSRRVVYFECFFLLDMTGQIQILCIARLYKACLFYKAKNKSMASSPSPAPPGIAMSRCPKTATHCPPQAIFIPVPLHVPVIKEGIKLIIFPVHVIHW